MELVERDSALRTLRRCLEGAGVRGHVALVSGEAGIGKTSLVRALAAGQADLWWGACDALQTPHPLGPLLDIVRSTSTRFADRIPARARPCSRRCSTSCRARSRPCWS